jgi:hypothetical protein
MGEWDITLCNINLGTTLHARRKRPQCPVKRPGEFQSHYGHDGQEKIFYPYQKSNL